MFSTAQLLSAFIGVLIPLANGLLTKYSAVKARVYLGLILSAANGLAVEWLNALTTSHDFNLTQAAGGALLSLITALAVEAKVWSPLGVSEALKSTGVGGSADKPAVTGSTSAGSM
jgi:hypothetical protein